MSNRKHRVYKFTVGDNVSREVDICDKSKGYKIGKILRRYSESIGVCKYNKEIILGPYPELYEVRWNNGKVEKGFLPHGLDTINGV